MSPFFIRYFTSPPLLAPRQLHSLPLLTPVFWLLPYFSCTCCTGARTALLSLNSITLTLKVSKKFWLKQVNVHSSRRPKQIHLSYPRVSVEWTQIKGNIPWASHSFSEFKRDIPQQLETTDIDTNLNPHWILTNPQTCGQLWCRTQTLPMKNKQCMSEQLVGRFSEQ